MFIPGLAGSNLYNGVHEEWFPDLDPFNSSVKDLFLTPTGASTNMSITVKDGEVMELAYGLSGHPIYEGLPALLDSLKSEHRIAEWKAMPYDWRLDYDALLSNGKVAGDRVSYTESTSSPYIIQTLNDLAAKAKSHKVIIITHSNGGLLAKMLVKNLADSNNPLLANIDQLIMVAPPQLGAPKSIAALLHGDQNPLSQFGAFAMRDKTFRQFSEYMPTMYNMLPSSAYNATTGPYATFANPEEVLYTNEAKKAVLKYGFYDMDPELNAFRTLYPNGVTQSNLTSFLSGEGGARTKPDADNLESPNVLSGTLLAHALNLHSSLDTFQLPPSIKVTQIVGWGLPTIAGIAYTRGEKDRCLERFPCKVTYKLGHGLAVTSDGDGTVPTKSASVLPEAKTVFVDLYAYNNGINLGEVVDSAKSREHSSVIGSQPVTALLGRLITSSTTDAIPYTTTIKPSGSTYNIIEKHSPVDLEAFDSYGNHTGYTTEIINGIAVRTIEENIAGSAYFVIGSSTYMVLPAGTSTHVLMHGTGEGLATIIMSTYVDDHKVASSSFVDLPITASTTGSITLRTVSDASNLTIDKDGNGTPDLVLAPQLNGVVTLPPTDTTPPEARLFFSTSTQRLVIEGIDTSSTSVLTTATTSTITDEAGNVTVLHFTKYKDSNKRTAVSIDSVSYNGIVTRVADTTLKYKWNIKPSGYGMFAAFAKTASSTLEAHYRPKKNQTIIMAKPTDFDDTDNDDDCDTRPTKLKLLGLVVPYLQTNKGSIGASY
jgi:pimeloyl-ACP methyl ester carboxylesterase